jgi:DNA mismatch repair protein MutS2
VEIARKIGLPEDLIADATSKVGSEYVHIDKYLQDIARDKRYWENKRQDIRKQEKQLENLTAKYTHDLDTLKNQRKEIIKEAKQQAQAIVATLNARIENTIREIREAQADKARTKEARQALEQFIETALGDGEILKQVQDDRDEHAAVRREAGKKGGHTTFCASRRILNQVQDDGDGRQAKEEYKVGDAVEVRGEKVGGVIVEVKGKEAVVAMGDIKVVVKLEKLQRTDKGKVNTVRKQTQGYATAEQAYQRKLNFKTDIDIRGMRANDALQTIVYFIDDALQTNTKQVRILHGTGNGVLRQVVRDYLKTVQNVKFGDELLSLGGTGITVVQLEI